jgi:mRNA interferase RelE/StbE
MTKKKAQSQQQYSIWMLPEVHESRSQLPGNVRQRIKQAIDGLGIDPHPSQSKLLDLSSLINLKISPEWEVRRVRLDEWRIVYAVNETWKEIAILAIEKRPPYDYEDLELLLSKL